MSLPFFALSQLLSQRKPTPSALPLVPLPGDPLADDFNLIRVPQMRAEDPDFLQFRLSPLNQRQQALQAQLQQAQALMQGSGQRHVSTAGTILGGIGDILRAGVGSYRQGKIQEQLEGLAKERAAAVEAFGLNPSESAVPRDESRRGRLLQRTLQSGQETFQAEQQDKRLKAEAKQGALNRALQRELEEGRTTRATDAAGKEDEQRRVKLEEQLRNEFQKLPPAVKAEQVVTAYRQVVSAAPTGVGDLQRIFAFVNLIDPGVAVRQEDVVNVGKTGGLPGQAQAYFNQLTAQGTLSPDVRRQMEESGRSVAQARLESYRDARTTYEGLARQYGVDPTRAVPDIGLRLDTPPAQQQAPQQPQMGATPAPAPGGVVGPGDPRNIVETRVLEDGTEIVIYADGRAVKRVPRRQ